MMDQRIVALVAAACGVFLACNDDRGSGDLFGDGSAEDGGGPGSGSGGGPGSSGGSGGTDGADDGGGTRYDVGSGEGGSGGGGSCNVDGDMDGIGDCMSSAPPDSFEPDVQWTWDRQGSITTPLVANLTDDNGDGVIDLCDTPDVVVVDGTIGVGQSGAGTIFVLDGQTGAEHFSIAQTVEWTLTPALGDIDGDGLVEIVAGTGGLGNFTLVAFEHDGSPKWVGAQWDWLQSLHSAIAMADLDNDGDVEIIAGNHVFNHDGTLSFIAPLGLSTINATTAADLDGDGDLEVIIGPAAYHHDGSQYYLNNTIPSTGIGGVFPQVANLDGDPEPEVLVGSGTGIFLLEHDGTTKATITPAGSGSAGGIYPATIHDFDGDGESEFALSSGTLYTVYEPAGTIAWSAEVVDASGVAAGTAFDFLGDGIAEAMYADEHTMFVFDGRSGGVVMDSPRSSGTSIEYPAVADVDNDGSAEIIVVSNGGPSGGKTAASVQVIRDRQDRWIQARRIWNQHTYHVTNVREDGTIPQHEKPNWHTLNTFRTNAQIEDGGVCIPPQG